MIRAIAGLINRDDKFLVAQRPAHKPYPGYWELPGGKIEANESSFAALKRELQEEIGINVLSATCLLEHEHRYPDRNIYLEIWRITQYIDEPQPLEQQILRWATWDEIEQLKVLEGNVTLHRKIRNFCAQCEF